MVQRKNWPIWLHQKFLIHVILNSYKMLVLKMSTPNSSYRPSKKSNNSLTGGGFSPDPDPGATVLNFAPVNCVRASWRSFNMLLLSMKLYSATP